MRSTFAGFTTAQLAMRASQKALDVTGQNIANVNTGGYTRQRLDLISLNSSQGVNKYESQFNVKVGSGVLTKGISQIRDPFLDVRFRTERANVGAEDQKLGILNDLEAIFDEVSKNGVQSQISEISSMLQKLSSEVGNDEFDSMVKSSADVLTKMLNQYATQLGGIREEQETNLNIDITKVNDIMKNIQKLNETIKTNNIHGSPALELQDQRNMLIDELSAYVKIDVKYNQTKISDAITVEIPEISLVGAGGKLPLIKGSFAAEFKISKDADGKVVASITRPDLSTDGANPGDPKVITPQADIAVNDEIISGALKATFDMLNKSGEFDGGSETTRGIGYYEKSLNILASKLAESFNKANQESVFDKDGNQITGIVADLAGDKVTVTVKNRNTGAETSVELTPADASVAKFDKTGKLLDGTTLAQDELYIKKDLFTSNDGNPITAKNLTISEGWNSGEIGITASTKYGSPLGANDNVLGIISMINEKQEYKTPDKLNPDGTVAASGKKIFKGSFQEMFTNTGSVLALDVKSTKSVLDNYVTVANEIANMRDNISSVSLDEEGMNILHYQKSYNAAARLMTALDEAINTIINSMGIVGR
ncbi:MAG: flagellar hook-associated protein FlgK [Proteocatella sp.]